MHYSQPVLEASGLVKRYSAVTAVQGVGFSIAAGQIRQKLGMAPNHPSASVAERH